MVDIVMDSTKRTTVGRLGENEHRRLVFDIADLQAMYPDAYYSMLCQRPEDEEAYPVADINLEIADGKLYWLLTNTELAYEGVGQCELVVSYGNVIAKTEIYAIAIAPALDGSGEMPEPWESWTQEVTELAREIVSDITDLAAEKTNEFTELANTAEQTVNRMVDDASSMALKSEGFAVGEQSGEPVTSESPYYNNNAKYYAEQAEQAAGQAGYMFFYIDEHGHLIYERTENVDVDFVLENGHLYVEVG